MTRLDIDLPVAHLSRVAMIAEGDKPPAWGFMQKPEFVAGSCVRFWHKGKTIATAEQERLQAPLGTRDPWWVWFHSFAWAASSC